MRSSQNSLNLKPNLKIDQKVLRECRNGFTYSFTLLQITPYVTQSPNYRMWCLEFDCGMRFVRIRIAV